MRFWLIFVTTIASYASASSLSGIYPTTEVLGQMVPKAAQIIILADTNHRLESVRSAISLSLPAFKKSNLAIDCILLEEDRRLQTAIDGFLQGDGDYEQILKARQSLLGDTAYGFAGGKALMNEARNEEIKVFAIDIDYSSDLGKKVQNLRLMGQLGLIDDQESLPNSFTTENWLRTIVDARSRNFAEQTSKLVVSNSCHRSLFLIGDWHLQAAIGKVALTPVQDRLKKLGIPSVIGTIASVKCDAPVGDANQDRICSDLKSGISDIVPILRPDADNVPQFVLPAE